ncbi:NAD(P)-dependent oxidoreductase [Marivibrio halodurans]|uniref:NAD(P)-dependent oxidoreductase n=1 Tax=Marivibrio halodurans TaxID=2039722 RepID=A0A8J7V296_9PROT|nr:NAD(P)-dependent oxidoreductase [Marivibrio halodurans]
MKTVLVTGGGGFLGKAVCEALAARGDAVVALDRGPSPGLDAFARAHRGARAVECDIMDAAGLDAVMAEVRPDAVIHCAAIVGVMASLESPAGVFRVNTEGAINLFQAMARHGVKRVLHISSEEIYGAFRAARIDEEHPQYPLYAYGVSKQAVEHLGRTYAASHGLACINLRTSWVYGPGFPRDRVPCNMVKAALRGQPLHVPHGASSRIDHTYIDDAVAGTLMALDHRDHPFDAYHIASDSAPSLAEIADLIGALVPGARITVGSGTYRHNGEVEIPEKGALRCDRAREVFGYRPRFDIRAGLSAYLDHVRAADAA